MHVVRHNCSYYVRISCQTYERSNVIGSRGVLKHVDTFAFFITDALTIPDNNSLFSQRKCYTVATKIIRSPELKIFSIYIS